MKSVSAALEGTIGHRHRTNAEDLKPHPVMHLDWDMALSLVTLLLTADDLNEVVLGRITFPELADDFIWGQFPPVRFMGFAINRKVDFMPLFSGLDFLNSGFNLSNRCYFFFLGLVQLGLSAAQVGFRPFQFITHEFPFLQHLALTAAFPLNIMSTAKFVKQILSDA